jgi:hypothetical protein
MSRDPHDLLLAIKYSETVPVFLVDSGLLYWLLRINVFNLFVAVQRYDAF